jgi:plasmid stabilization system protein ParE
MSEYRIVFSPHAKQRLEEIAAYLYKQQLSKSFVRDYLHRFETWLEAVLGQFPDSGSPMLEYGKDIRRIVYQKYSFVYRLKGNEIEILTIYRENQP